MSRKVKKTGADSSFSLGGLYERISSLQPSSFVITVTWLAVTIFLLSGGIFSITNSQGTVGYYNNQFYFFYPSLTQQFISDTIISASLFALGFLGLLFLYQSSKSAYKPRQAYIMLTIGVTLLLISYLILEYAIQYKISGGQ
jgi:hypothetical protein